jgi:chromosome partitioning protein
MKTVALYSIKGGVGKSTLAVNLAYLSATNGAKTLLIDLDAQGASSYLLNVTPLHQGGTKDLLKGRSMALNQIRASDYRNLDVLPAHKGLRNLDIRLYEEGASLSPLVQRLREDYDSLILDCPPQFGATGEAIVEVSDTLIIPVIPNPASTRTVGQLHDFLQSRKIQTGTILPLFYMANPRTRIHSETMASMRADWPLCPATIIPFSTDFELMGQMQKPLPLCRPRSHANLAMNELYQELHTLEII